MATFNQRCEVFGCGRNKPCALHGRRSTSTPARAVGFYDERWKRFRAAWLRRNPFCGDREDGLPSVMSRCRDEGRVVPATAVDHVEPHKGDKTKFWRGPFQSLCASCNGRKGARDGRKDREK